MHKANALQVWAHILWILFSWRHWTGWDIDNEKKNQPESLENRMLWMNVVKWVFFLKEWFLFSVMFLIFSLHLISGLDPKFIVPNWPEHSLRSFLFFFPPLKTLFEKGGGHDVFQRSSWTRVQPHFLISKVFKLPLPCFIQPFCQLQKAFNQKQSRERRSAAVIRAVLR